MGADNMQGGTGDDTYVVDDVGDIVTEAASAGTDTVQSSIIYTLTANVENLTLTGTEDLSGTGNTLNNIITGNSGNNVLDGGAGADTMAGGGGDDTYIVDNASDVIVEAANGGNDTVYSSASYTLSANVENLVLTGAAAINGTGNAQDNVITGNGSSNVLSGMAGNDLLIGGAGNDTLDGGLDADTMHGGEGNDTYVVDNAGDLVVENADEGTDTVQSSISYTLTANVENLTLTGSASINGTGNALDNVITGNTGNNVLNGLEGNDTLIGSAGNDTLNGGVGADNMQGGTGDDTYVVDDVGDIVTEAASAGTDTVQSSISYTLTANVENLTLTGTEDLSGTGNTLNNVITGNSGNNVLDGGAGADTMSGGRGDDTYIVDNTGDAIAEALDGGVDTVHASANYTLSANVENLVLVGTANISGTGNALANSLIGNNGNNVLDGAYGDDIIHAGAGNDVLIGGEGDDLLNGEAGDDQLFGDAGNDTLDGGAGVDSMRGGAGNDTYIVDNVADVVVEVAGGGIDKVLASVSYTLSDNVEILALTGDGDINGTGNASDNVLIGTGGNNTLVGMEGNDTLDGGFGDDVLMGGAGDDQYVFRLGDGSDRIIDTQGSNTLHVGSGLTEANLHGEREGDDMVITVLGSTESIVLADWFSQPEGVNHIVFDDGTQLDRQGIELLLNRPPVAAADSVTVYEDGGIANIPVTHLLANDTDPNPEDVLTVISVGESQVGASVSLVDGTVQYDIGDRFQQLAEGEVLKDSFAYTISDDQGATSTSVVEVNIVGINDAPVVSIDTAQAMEDVLTSVSGNVLANDSDVDSGTVLQVASPGTMAGIYGNLTLAQNGSYTYSLNSGADNVQSLSQGQVVLDRFSYVATDGIAGVASNLEITITGTNDAPVVTADVAQVTEDALISTSGNVLANDSDVDAGTTLQVVSPGTFVGAYGNLTLAADGSYSYSLDNSALHVQSLAQGQVVIDRFTYAATDGIVDVSSVLDIAITGTNDAPVVTADTAQVTEDTMTSASGNVLANDSDIDAGTLLKVAAPGTIAGTYGDLSIAQDGRYTYRLNNAAANVQTLGRQHIVADRFAYAATDGIVEVTSGLEVTVQGTNDAPILVASLADQDFTFNKPFSWQMPEGSFTDIDEGDTLTYAATLADGSALPSWLFFDAATQTFSGFTPKEVGYIDIRVTATDKVAANGSTEGSLSASDVFRLSVSHGNQGVGNGQDSSPAGHGSNFNDGPGTAPGNPGAKGGRVNVGMDQVQNDADGGKAGKAGGKEQEVETSDTKAGKQTVPAYLNSSQLEQYAPSSASSIGNISSAQAFAHWLTVDLAVSAALADQKSLSWLDDRLGADTSGLSKATVGYLGSTTSFGGDALSLVAGTGKEMKTFQGLGKGVAKIS
ncbi:beta strand repeat-containing protein [Noviherbaspirillum agri]